MLVEKSVLEQAINDRNEKISNSVLTSAINYYVSDDDKEVTFGFLDPKQIGIKIGNVKASNMQSVEACFEAWATIIYTHYLKKAGTVVLSADFSVDPDWSIFENPHYGRFLYRALRFFQQYEWFSLDEKLKAEVMKFDEYLRKGKFTNNSPKKECSKNPAGLESVVESLFAKTDSTSNRSLKKKLGLNNKIYRQLPVGLFKNEILGKNQIFARKKAAIDLWTIQDDTFYLIELKAENKMVGAITEIFFYSNYAFDLFIKNDDNDKNSPFVLDKKENKRGYDQIIAQTKNLKRVNGFLLLDKGSDHPFITDEVIDVLNNTKSGSPNIEYGKIPYTLAIEVN